MVIKRSKESRRPKRCLVCNKIIREENKSNLCSYHYSLNEKRKLKKNYINI